MSDQDTNRTLPEDERESVARLKAKCLAFVILVAIDAAVKELIREGRRTL